MKSRQIPVALFIKFDNRYRPPERGKTLGCMVFLVGGREGIRELSKTAFQSFSHFNSKASMGPPIPLFMCTHSSAINRLIKTLTFGSSADLWVNISHLPSLLLPQEFEGRILGLNSSDFREGKSFIAGVNL